MKRTLSLKKESLSELRTDDLSSVVGAGGTHLTCYTGLTWCDLCQIDRTPIPTVDSPCQTR